MSIETVNLNTDISLELESRIFFQRWLPVNVDAERGEFWFIFSY